MTEQSTATADQAMAQFERTTSRWGRITMIAGLLISVAAPLWLVATNDIGVTWSQVLTAYLAVAAVFLVFAIVEPITYFPILGQAAMYQAFMIGNISNKLLPAAIVAQGRTDATPGTRKGDLVAVMAICGAALVHLVSLLVFVGILGTVLLSVIPAEITEVAQLYILPSILGAVLVQGIITVRQPRTTVIAVVIALVMLLVVVPVLPVIGNFATAIAVVITVLLSWFLRRKQTA